ncbi:MAG TPA: ammonium transporter, partial [Vicinamibacterales bacterium]|nr:ammonium transporter [Vicinamibacterales bacterium]
MTKKILLLLATALCLARGTALAQAPEPAAPVAQAQAVSAATPITDTDLKAAVKPTDRTNGDPDGSLTGTANDITVSDAKAGLTMADVLNQIGANKIGVNFAWTLLCGFLIMFMQAGFAVVEAGLCRAKNANHTMMMNFMVYGVGMLAYFLIGFPLQMGGAGAVANLGGTPVLNSEFTFHLFGKDIGLFGNTGYLLMHRGTYDVAVMVIFLFQMVFMDTTTTIVTGTCCERWKYAAFMVSTMFLGAFTYPIFANWAWGGGWLAMLGSNFGLGHGDADFAGSGVVHSVGGITALACALILGPRIGKFTRDGKPNPIPGHDIMWVLCGCFILAFGWFGFNPGSTLSGTDLRIAFIVVNTMLASVAGAFATMVFLMARGLKPDPGMMVNGMLAGLVAITAPCAFVAPWAAVVIGAISGVIVVVAVGFFDNRGVDDPVGAISVHGVNGLWGVLSVGIFANGDYGAGWNGVVRDEFVKQYGSDGVRGILF